MTKKGFSKNSAGASLVELMIGLTIFVIVILSIGGAHQLISRNLVSARMGQKAIEYANAEISQLERISRIPERDVDGKLVYRDSNNNIVTSGGALVPFGYSTFLTDGALPGSPGEIVTYPDILSEQLAQTTLTDKVQLKREFSVATFNPGQEGEYKEITVTLSDARIPQRFRKSTVTTIIKKPHPKALDTRLAQGTASLTGRVMDKQTGNPISVNPPITVTLRPNDETAPRYASVDNTGRFYFAPPLNTGTGYTISFERPDSYWPKTLPVTLTPGVNSIAGDNGDIVELDPFIYASVHYKILELVSETTVPNIQMVLYDDNGGPEVAGLSNANGDISLQIKIPEAGITTYPSYYPSLNAAPGYICWSNSPSDWWDYLPLNKDVPFSGVMHITREEYGSLSVVVRNPDNSYNTKAQVEIYDGTYQSWLIQSKQTNGSGEVVFDQLPINSSNNLTATKRSFKIRVTSANHLRVEQVVTDLNVGESRASDITLPDHRLYWAPQNYNIQMIKGTFDDWVQTKAYYEGHQGPGITNIALGPNPQPLLGEKITSGGIPATFSYLSDNPSVLSAFYNTADFSRMYANQPGVANVHITATLAYEWNNTPYSLTISTDKIVTVLDTNDALQVWLSPTLTSMAPGQVVTFSVGAAGMMYNTAAYTFTVTGPGAASVVYQNNGGQPWPNGTGLTYQCKITASNQIGDTFNIRADAAYEGRTGSANMTITIQSSNLAVAINPPGPSTINPDSSKSFSATPSGGSGSNYKVEWSLLDPGTSVPISSTIATLTSGTGLSTSVLAKKIADINVVAKVTDLNTNATAQAISLLHIVPPGGSSE